MMTNEYTLTVIKLQDDTNITNKKKKWVPYEIKNKGIKVLERVERYGNSERWKVRCICFCGKEFITSEQALRNNYKESTRSCGCLKRHTHRMTKSDTYHTWVSMKKRCLYQKHPAYKNYGGSGITVCKRWLKFENFLKDMGERPFKKAVLDRINGLKGYSKINCRWVTQKQNTQNSKSNLIIDGVKFCLIADICKKYDINKATIYSRFKKNNWTLKECLQIPVKGKEDVWPKFKKEVKRLVLCRL